MNSSTLGAASLVTAAAATVAAGLECTEVQTCLSRTTAVDAADIAQVVADAEGDVEVEAPHEYDLKGARFFSEGVKRPGSKDCLHCLINKFPTVVLAPDFQRVEVKELGLSLPSSGFNQAKLERLLWREFLSLERKAKRSDLVGGDRDKWLAWSAFFDYARYREETAPLLRSIGELIAFGEDYAEVRWNGADGGLERVYGENALKLSIVNPGECFSALTRFVDFKLSQLEDVRPGDVLSSAESEDLSWIS